MEMSIYNLQTFGRRRGIYFDLLAEFKTCVIIYDREMSQAYTETNPWHREEE